MYGAEVEISYTPNRRWNINLGGGLLDTKITDSDVIVADHRAPSTGIRSEEHTSELQSLMRISYAVFCLKKTKTTIPTKNATQPHQHTHIINKYNKHKLI